MFEWIGLIAIVALLIRGAWVLAERRSAKRRFALVEARRRYLDHLAQASPSEPYKLSTIGPVTFGPAEVDPLDVTPEGREALIREKTRRFVEESKR